MNHLIFPAIAGAFLVGVVFFSVRSIMRERWERYRRLGFHTTPRAMYFGRDPVVCVPLNVAGVTDTNQLRRSGELFDLRYTTLHRVNTPSDSYKVPGHPVKVHWQLPDDPAAILRFHAKVPHHRIEFTPEMRPAPRHLADEGLFPRRSFYDFLNSGQDEFVLAKIAPLFQGLPPETEPNFIPLFREYGIRVEIDEFLPPPPPPPAEPVLDGVRIAEGVWIETAQRPQHVYILGRPESGKSTLIRTMVVQDLINGRGCAVVDPHGDLIEQILDDIPASRRDDVILFSPRNPIALNVFRATSEVEKDLLADDVITLFRRLSDTWGPRMDAILKYAVRTLLEVPGATFLDIHRLLVDPSYRSYAVNTANNPAIGSYWEREYSNYPKDAASPILSRLGQFVVSTSLSKILGQTSALDFYDIMQSGKVFLVDISTGGFGPETSKLLGSLIVSQFQLAAMRRVHLKPDQRRPFYLYVDEFQNFKTSAFPVILSEARKYGLYLTMAHQYVNQLDDDTRRAVLGTVGNRIFFALGHEDARYVQPYIGAFDAQELMDFDRGDAILSPPKTSQAKRIKTVVMRLDPRSPHATLDDILKNTPANAPPIVSPVAVTADPDDEPGPSGPPPK